MERGHVGKRKEVVHYNERQNFILFLCTIITLSPFIFTSIYYRNSTYIYNCTDRGV